MNTRKNISLYKIFIVISFFCLHSPLALAKGSCPDGKFKNSSGACQSKNKPAKIVKTPNKSPEFPPRAKIVKTPYKPPVFPPRAKIVKGNGDSDPEQESAK